MSSFIPQTTKAPAVFKADPTKHVRYVRGMVLGEDDLIQEFAYLSGRDQWIVRELIGYGTACGLQVTLTQDGGQTSVHVDAGVAVNPQGQLINVPEAQCAVLDKWLEKDTQQDALKKYGSSATVTVPVYVVLCYRECETNPVPLPGEPCRTEEASVTNSRIQDSFQLELRFDAPEQTEEDALRDFVAWLSQIELTTGSDFTSLEDFELALRNAPLSSPISSPLSPPSSPINSPISSPLGSPLDFMLSTPPAWLKISSSEIELYLRTAFRIWVTELRPHWLGKDQTCAKAPAESCVLLAEIGVSLVHDLISGAWDIDVPPQDDSINEERRPYLLHLRMLQEWLLRTYEDVPTLEGNVTGPADDNVVEKIQNIDVATDAPANADVMAFQGGKWTPTPLDGDVSVTLPAPVRGSVTVTGLQTVPVDPTAPATGEVLTFDGNQWTHTLPSTGGGGIDELEGNVTGAPTANTVVKIQGINVSATAPTTNGQLLTYQNNQWQPLAPTGDVEVISTATSHKINVTGLRDKDIAASPAPSDGQVLTFRGDNWVPETPVTGGTGGFTGNDVVGGPADSMVQGIANIPIQVPFPIGGAPLDGQSLRYNSTARPPAWEAADPTIVAMGIVQQGNVRTLVHDNLRITAIRDGVMSLIFDSYVPPVDKALTYVVKALPIMSNQKFMIHVQFGSFDQNGFTLLFFGMDLGLARGQFEPLATNLLAELPVMVEVTRYQVEKVG